MGTNANRDGGRAPHPYADPAIVGPLHRAPTVPTSPLRPNRDGGRAPHPFADPAIVGPVPRAPTAPNFPPLPAPRVARSNAIRRAARPPPGPDVELKDIEINGDWVNKALGLTPTHRTYPRARTTTLTQPPPPLRRAPPNSSTLPPHPAPRASRPPLSLSSRRRGLPLPPSPRPLLSLSSRRRHGMTILIPQDLPQELRDIQLSAAMTRDDDST
ncbi:hypothetical protein PtB15_2B39 [Puccinia triticina]|nr:hypothetical protein PtB15_2B39 [Puccinia triticina]